MSQFVYFILHQYTLEETIFVAVPKALHKEAWIYIADHTEYAIGAVADGFVEEPEEITSLREILRFDLKEGLRSFWHTLWLRDRDFALDDLTALAEKGEWQRVIDLILDIKRKEIEANAPYRIYTVPEGPLMSGNPPAGTKVTVGRKTAEMVEEDQLGEEVPVEQILSDEYGRLGEIVGEFAHRYTEAQRILDRLDALESQKAK